MAEMEMQDSVEDEQNVDDEDDFDTWDNLDEVMEQNCLSTFWNHLPTRYIVLAHDLFQNFSELTLQLSLPDGTLRIGSPQSKSFAIICGVYPVTKFDKMEDLPVEFYPHIEELKRLMPVYTSLDNLENKPSVLVYRYSYRFTVEEELLEISWSTKQKGVKFDKSLVSEQSPIELQSVCRPIPCFQ
jgi:hypothetical protein